MERLTRFGIQPGLERIRALLERVGNPHLKYPVVLIGGTNGKGSVVEFVARILHTAGYRTGIYTSPHLYRYNERIRINGAEISDDDLLRLLRTVEPHVEAVAQYPELGHPTQFEVLTLIGLLYFAEQNVDVAVLEVGLGGKWDATNVTEPIVSAVVTVDLDHVDRLGGTIQAIAADKVHIARPGKPLVTAETKPDALRAFREHCDKMGARLVVVAEPRSDLPPLRMLGDFQKVNATLSWKVAELLQEQGFALRDDAIRRGLSEATLPGRFEIVRTSPTVVLDGALNPEAARTLARNLRQHFSGRRLLLVMGVSADKLTDDLKEEMVAALAPLAEVFIATQANNPRAAPAAQIAAFARPHTPDVRAVAPVMDAVKLAMQLAQPDDVVCVTGSFYVIGEVEREVLGLR
ncbi:MAG: folylpolyglutamate synthase/dihydrofolate synthase family protein [Abditibacteriales bacterium]|nr:folylpolyglutamate synthase/dihydrofolate synthase family protein [Abditibacteriales bacterium]